MSNAASVAYKPTKRMLAFLKWLDGEGQVSMWPIEWCVIRKKAEGAGLIEMVGKERQRAGLSFAVYALSERGRKALGA